MKKLLGLLRDILTLALVLGIVFGAGFYFGQVRNNEAETVVEQRDAGFKLPGEVEKRVVTIEEVAAKLLEIGELSTYAGEYTCTLGKEETKYWLEKIPVLWSTNEVAITCEGVVKVGYDLTDISIQVDDEAIYIAIPEAKINDNYVIWDSVTCEESNSIFNPIEFEQYRELIEEIEKKGLEEVTDGGIYNRAEKHLKVLIEAFLSEFTDYRIVYM